MKRVGLAIVAASLLLTNLIFAGSAMTAEKQKHQERFLPYLLTAQTLTLRPVMEMGQYLFSEEFKRVNDFFLSLGGAKRIYNGNDETAFLLFQVINEPEALIKLQETVF